MKKFYAFTLAEVLITLGIIGIVAALTIPTLMGNHRKSIAETRLAKFYSVINQAVLMSEIENGDHKDWDPLGVECDFDEETGSCKSGSIVAIQWYYKYLEKYLNVIKVDTKRYEHDSGSSNKCILYFSDGSLFEFNGNAGTFFPSAKDFDKCVDDNEKKCLGTKSFTFYFKQDGKKAFEPYNSGKDKTFLLNDSTMGCNHTASNKYVNCAAIIQANGWKIPDDYPLRF